MKRVLTMTVLLTLALGTRAVADRPTKIIGPGLNSGRTVYHQTFNRTLSSDTTYILTGLYIVDSLKSITIEPGTVIEGDTVATLVIARGGDVFAEGMPDCPIVFTSTKPIGSRGPGDWGGVVILGAAPTNQANPVIEGGIVPGSYGGGGIGLGNPDDNSGIFRYVRIEYCGYRYQLNNEINGLTMGGVGRGTQIDHVQVSYSFDDSFEWFGGTVDCRYLVAYSGWDDDFDTDFGFEGRLQFVFALRNPDNHEVTGVGQSNGFESDNKAVASTTNPRTLPRFSNATMIGPRRTDATPFPLTAGFEYGFVIRRGTECSVYNSIVMGYLGGYSMRDGFTMDAANADILQGRNISLQEDGALQTMNQTGTPPPGFTLVNWFNTAGWNNIGGSATDAPRAPSTIGLVNMSSLTNPDPRPAPGSEPTTAGVEFTNLNALAGGYFTPTTYRGAFDPSLPLDQQWTAEWTNFDPQNFDVNGFTTVDMINGWNLVSVDRTVSNYTGNVVYPGVLSLYEYNTATGTYTNVTTSNVVNGKGYWARYLSDLCNTIEGTSLASVSQTVTAAGWVLIGTPSSPVIVSSGLHISGATLLAGPFGYDGTIYSTVTNLLPGRGYWVRVSGPCTITVGP